MVYRQRLGPRVKGLRGRRTRMYLKGKKFQVFKTYNNIKPAFNIDESSTAGLMLGRVDNMNANQGGGIAMVIHDPDAREIWFGPTYAAANVGALHAAGNAFDADANPITNGDGLLDQINRRDPTMDFHKFYYSAMRITQGEIIAAWNRVNRQVAMQQVYVKAIKVS